MYPDWRLRFFGPLLFFCVDVILMLSELYSIPLSYVALRVCASALFHVLMVWEPVRAIIGYYQRRYAGVTAVRKRGIASFATLVPYAVLAGFFWVYAEDRVNLWGKPILHLAGVAYNAGITVLYVLIELFAYESHYHFGQVLRQQREAEALKRVHAEMQLDSLRSQVQPHFLFNTLQSLIGFIRIDPKKAVRYTEDLADVYRYLLVANERSLAPLEEEVDFCKAYLALYQGRFGQSLHYRLPDAAASRGLLIPALTLQLLVENALKHNRCTPEEPLSICVDVSADGEALLVSNTLQPVAGVISTGNGLKHLWKKFGLLGLPVPQQDATGGQFVVQITLVREAVPD